MERKGRLVHLLILAAALLVGAAGGKSGLESKDRKIRGAAVQKFTNQPQLAKVALEDQKGPK